LAAGIEPDSRIGEGRGQPAWCTFRDAARREHMAAEQAVQAVVAAEMAANTIAPQAEKYQNSPLKIFGQHDENTVAQTRNCMSIGNAVAGVICS
jgi:tRNA-splicing ligase RtcB